MIRLNTLKRAIGSILSLFFIGASLGNAQSPDLITVEAKVPQWVESIEIESEFAGLLQARRRSHLSFERVGRLEIVHVQRGDIVEVDQVLAELNTDILHSQIKKLTADHLSALAVLDELVAGPRPETIAAAKAAVREQQALYDNAKQAYERRRKLHSARLIATEELDQASTSMAQYKETTEGAAQRLSELEVGTRIEQIAAQKATVAALAAAIETLNVELAHSRIRSPFAGTVSDRMLDEGAIVAPGQAVLTVLETSDMEVHVGVPIDVATHLKRGDIVDILIRDVRVPGSVRSIVNEIDRESRTQQLIIKLNNESTANVIPGENARLAFSRSQKVDGFWMPVAAMVRGPRGLWECYVVPSLNREGIGEVSKCSLEILETQGERVFVRGAIDRSARIIVSATHRVTLGQRVRVAMDEAKP